MDAPCKIQGNIHVLLCLIHKLMCPGFWVHIILASGWAFFDKNCASMVVGVKKSCKAILPSEYAGKHVLI